MLSQKTKLILTTTKTELKKPTARPVVVRCVNCFKSISVPSRMIIYNYLNFKKKEATVGNIVDQLNLTQPTVSYHLKEMKHSGLLKSKRIGKEVFYAVSHICPHHKKACILQNLKFPEK
ncbi:winged helix-turn-helix transcriptional regulator [candidate division WWE3 bacterium]|nr:winged helix-turn-helix transcriptional regulator [candidate division WWE3 bacterium]